MLCCGGTGPCPAGLTWSGRSSPKHLPSFPTQCVSPTPMVAGVYKWHFGYSSVVPKPGPRTAVEKYILKAQTIVGAALDKGDPLLNLTALLIPRVLQSGQPGNSVIVNKNEGRDQHETSSVPRQRSHKRLLTSLAAGRGLCKVLVCTK